MFLSNEELLSAYVVFSGCAAGCLVVCSLRSIWCLIGGSSCDWIRCVQTLWPCESTGEVISLGGLVTYIRV